MVIRRSRVLLKRIYENQHKFKKVERYCSSSLRIQEYEEQVHQNIPSVTQTHQQPINDICHTPYANYPPAPQRTEDLTPDISFKFKDMNVTLAAPNQLHPKPDVSDLIFGKFFTDHMLKIYYYKQLGGWQRPEIIPFENLAIHPAAKVLHYAVELFEGMKAYRGVDDRIRVFRPDLNMKRMNMSAKRSGLPTFDDEELIQCMNRLISIDQEWVPHSESSSLYIRPTLIGIDPTLGVSSSDSALLYAILCPVGSYFKAGSDGAVSLLADPNVIRAWPGGVGDRKMGSNYAPTIDVQSRASKLGLQQVLWLYGENHQLTEVGTMNIFMVSINEHGEKQITTPPLNGLILPGITRHSILQLARQWGDLLIKEEIITMGEVISLANEGRLLELFGSGTACIVSPIKSINYVDQIIKIPTMQQSQPIFRRVLDTLLAIQYGHIDHPWSRIIN